MIEQAAKPRKQLHELLNWKVVLITCAILLAIFGIACKYDFQISKVMHWESGAYKPTLIIYSYMICVFVVLAFSLCWVFVISSFSFKHDKVWVPILGSIFGWMCIVMFGLYIYYTMRPFKEFYGEKIGMIHNITILALILVGSFIFAMFLFGDKLNKDMCKRTFTYLLEVLIVVVLILLFKCIWSRPTPWNVFDTTVKYDFVPWWKPNPFYCFKQNQQASLYFWTTPAGYVSQGAVIVFATTSTLEQTKRWDKRKLHAVFFYAASSYAIVLSLVRLMAGESYLTDIALSLCFGLLISYGSKQLAKIARKKFYGHEE